MSEPTTASHAPKENGAWVSAWWRSIRDSSLGVRIAAIGLGMAMGFAQIIGWRIEVHGTLGLDGKFRAVLLLAECLLASAVFIAVLFPLFYAAKHWTGLSAGQPRGLWALSPVRRRLAIIGALIGGWIFYWILLWPGVTSIDTYRQIQQILGETPYSDHHPIAHTLAIQAILRPAIAVTGSIPRGLAVVTLVQLVVLAIIIGLCIDALRSFVAPNWARTVILLFFALHPMIGWYSVTLWKDIWLAAFVLLLGTISARIVTRHRQGLPSSWQWWAAFVVAALGVMLSKKTGIFLVAPLVLATVFFVRGMRVRWLSFGVGAIIAYLAAHVGLMAALSVSPGSAAEAFSLPSQQIARAVRDHAVDLSAQDLADLSRFYPDKDLGDIYTPRLADPTKGALDTDALAADKPGYLRLWARLGAEHPKTYVEAMLANTSGYWYPGTEEPLVSANNWDMIVTLVKEGAEASDELLDPTAMSLRGVVSAELRQIPGINLFLSLGTWTWVAAVLSAAAILRRKPAAVPVIVLQLMVWLTCMISPVAAEARYAYPILLLLPLLAVVTLQPLRPSPVAGCDEEPVP